MSKFSKSTCQYGRDEEIIYNYDDRKKRNKTYDTFVCPLPSEIDSKYCCFHDPDRSKFTWEEINKKFLKYIEKPDLEELEEKGAYNEYLYCIGFFLTQDQIDIIPEKRFTKIYFNHARFYSGIKFSYRIFPSLDFSDSEIHKYVDFSDGIFNDVLLSNSKFINIDYIHFYHSEFRNFKFSSSDIYGADFQFTVFNGEVNLSGIFEGEVNFTRATFHKKCTIGITFKGQANFYLATFYEHVKFSSDFFMEANFAFAEFHEGANFSNIKFYERARFYQSKFLKSQTIFSGTTFYGYCDFSYAIFENRPLFDHITCTIMDFEYTDFYDLNFINWKINSQFYNNNHDFYDTKYVLDNKSEFLELVKSKKIIDSTESYDIKQKLSNNIEFHFNEFGEKTIIIKIINHDRLLIYYKRNNEISSFAICYNAPINFAYAIIRNRSRVIESDLSNVSFKGVNLSNVEFHSVSWLKRTILEIREKKSLMQTFHDKIFSTLKRFHDKIFSKAETEIIDSMLENKNYKNVSYVYNQLRKNFETDLRFSEASDFFIGEMESIRWGLWKGKTIEKCKSIGYGVYRYIALYGESISLPLMFWTPIIIFLFFIIRYSFNIYSLDDRCMPSPLVDSIFAYFYFGDSNIGKCNFFTQIMDSISLYFQVPRSNNSIDIIERIISAPILGTTFIALKRRFERR